MAIHSLLLIGCGKMGSALLSGWLAKTVLSAKAVTVVEPDADVRRHFSQQGIYCVGAISDLDPEAHYDYIVLAVKPQSMDNVLPLLSGRQSTFISIAAGKTIAYYENYLGPEAAIVRAMPNTPALIGKGMTVYCRNRHIPSGKMDEVKQLFAVIGDIHESDEAQMDAVTALSGSGPAYVFLFAEAMAEAGVQLGLDQATALKLALTTLHGSAHLADKSELSLDTLRRNVTSPGGTTEAALKVMSERQLVAIFADALAAAARRGKELAQS